MRLFHITDKVYRIGETVSAEDFGESCFYHKNNPINTWINEVLDEGKDADCPSRKRCIYAFNELGHCLAFNNNPNLHCYLVEMDAHGGFPMVLTDKLRRLGKDSCQIDDVVREYWHPTNNWKFNEFLGNSMVIIEEIITEGCFFAMRSKMLYGKDRDLADSLFKTTL
ncbi:MAG: hypothetical protein IKZ50_01500 [Bacteroidales bacterium]|nr:hypothetical protein [Bacteroidales bacterium]